jgi:hypothetical protein
VLVYGERDRLVQAREAIAVTKDEERDAKAGEKEEREEKEGDEEMMINGVKYSVVRMG